MLTIEAVLASALLAFGLVVLIGVAAIVLFAATASLERRLGTAADSSNFEPDATSSA